MNTIRNVGIYSFYLKTIPTAILEYQKLVFSKFDIDLTQVCGRDVKTGAEKHKEHGHLITDILKNTHHDYYLIFDVDTVPINKSFKSKIFEDLYSEDILVGAVGCANHIDKDYLYVHPCCMALSKKLYIECGSPNLTFDSNNDTAQILTRLAHKNNKIIKFWDVTDCDTELWDLRPLNKKFGYGTVYENCVYHQYNISSVEQNRIDFLNKCKCVLKDNKI